MGRALQRLVWSLCRAIFSGGAFLSEADASGGGAAEISFKNPTHATSICAGSHLTIAPRVVPARHSWQHFEASTAVRIGSACSVRTGVRHGPLSLPNHMGQPIFAAARARARLWQPRRHAPPVRPPALLTLRKRAQAPTRPKARDPPRNWLFLKGDEPASRSNKRPVYK